MKAASKNFLMNIPTLNGRENYDKLAFAAENFLIIEGVQNSIKEEPAAEGEGAAAFSVSNSRTKAKMIALIDPALYVHV